MVEYSTERTLYPILLKIFEELGFSGVQEISLSGRKYPDIKISYKDNAFYVQVKIGKLDTLRDILNDISKLMARREMYSQIKDVIGFIGVKFEESIRKIPLVTGREEQILRNAIENTKVFVVISAFKEERPLFYIIDGDISFSEAKQQIVEKLKEFIEERKVLINPESVVRLLKEYTNELAFILRAYYLSQPSEALVNLVGDISLFKSLLGVKEEDINKLLKNEDYKAAIVDLLAFILVNQILFYYLYSKRSKGKLPELKQVSSLLELRRYFDKILEIDFRVIYSINIFEKLPNDKQILNTINNIIDVLNANPVWKIPHDLLGRIYHELLPFRTRKVFATFYTHPIAAEILAGLTIDNYKETVIDPACGSGTLLVAAYNTKKKLYIEQIEQRSFISVEDEIRLHKQFVEKDITGIDIMPFAAHIAAMNLALQNIEAETNNLRIGVEDSLDILDKLASINHKDWTLALETVSTELVKIIKSLKSRQESLLKYLNNNKENKVKNIIIYTIDTSDAEDLILTKLKEKGYKIFSIDDKNVNFNSNYIAIIGINSYNINKLQNIFRKLIEIDKLNLAIIVRKGRLSESIIEDLKEIFEDILIETRDIFTIKPFDVVIMNPPFTDYEKLPFEYQDKLRYLNHRFNFIRENVGGRANLWIYFLILTHFLLKDNGKIGAVIPINIARGAATEKIRKFLLENYYIRWIIKPIVDLAFSEAAAFRDILFIAEKRKPKEDDITGIVFIKKSIRSSEFTIEEARRIVRDLRILYEKAKEGKIKHYKDPDGFYEVYFIDYKILKKYKDNLMPLLKETSLEEDLMEIVLERAKDKLKKLHKNDLKEGFHPKTKGIGELLFLVRPLDKARIIRNVISIIDTESEYTITIRIKKTGEYIKIPKFVVVPACKSPHGLRKMDITDIHDYFISKPFRDFNKLLLYSRYPNKNPLQFDWKYIEYEIKRLSKREYHILISERFGISKSMHLLAFYTEYPFTITTAAFIFIINKNKEESKQLIVWLNSVLYWYQIIKLSKETQGEYIEIRKPDLLQTYILNINKLSDREKKLLLDLFEEIKDIKFPSIMEQMKKGWEYIKQFGDKPWEGIFDYLKKIDLGTYARIKLDYTILKVLGFRDNEIKELLEKAYKAVYEELKAIKKAK